MNLIELCDNMTTSFKRLEQDVMNILNELNHGICNEREEYETKIKDLEIICRFYKVSLISLGVMNIVIAAIRWFWL